MKKIFTLIVAFMAIFNTAKAEEIVLFEGSEVLGWGGCILPTSSITETKDLTLNVTVEYSGDWCQYCMASTVEGWPKIQFCGAEFFTSGSFSTFTSGKVGESTDSFDLTPEMIEAMKAGGSVAFQGSADTSTNPDAYIKLKKVTLTTKVNYETEGRSIAFDEYGSILASAFNGLSDDAKIEFVYNIAGTIDKYMNWGCGQLKSIDQSVDLNKGFPITALGDNSMVMKLGDIKHALNAGPDQSGRYGLYWNMWGQGDGAVTATRVSVKAYEIAGFTGEGYKDPTSAGTDTGIENITVQPEGNGAAYNIAGQRVNSTAKGLVIRNGKKFFVK